MKRSAAAPHRFRVSLVASVRARLTLWYMGAFAGVMLLFGGSLYASQVWLNSGAAESRMQTQLYQDSGTFENSYRQALQRGESPGEQRLSMSSNEIVLLLSPDGSVLDKRGPLPDNLVQQLWTRSESSSQLDISIAQPKSSSSQWWHEEGSNYHVLVTPVLNQNARIAVLMVGLERGYTMPLLTIWLFHGLGVLLIAAFGGYWLAGKALRPVKMITRTANEINATDLRRRLHFKRRDEFGELAAT
ncbi:MAG: HAMP domain-containing protein, partial [Ktedonobacteraceae bacterium]|nr:HAMP domain-containing protein [Ktedonobacteraceae bacterium]